MVQSQARLFWVITVVLGVTNGVVVQPVSAECVIEGMAHGNFRTVWPAGAVISGFCATDHIIAKPNEATMCNGSHFDPNKPDPDFLDSVFIPDGSAFHHYYCGQQAHFDAELAALHNQVNGDLSQIRNDLRSLAESIDGLTHRIDVTTPK